MKENDIIYESANGFAWVAYSKKQNAYIVYKNMITHSVSDSGYLYLSLAKARADYIDKRAST